MGQKEKLIQRLKSNPKDFTFDEAESLLKYFDYECSNKGKTSGSRIIFSNKEHGSILLHKPHPGNELKSYQVKQLITLLTEEGFI
ncbi:type II toxin-antitoxin system HicA family toxin [Stomatobaculum longum]|uniref:type II toxin-antitoxin system HicA family toxin n=1 Tax=Stomatobaculum longum TaxID=796942 RepID=UPI00280534B1|nr:type II toxin-antitoxin system HicA family toxin [Stomatobaculum longum]